jgi:hypothetical protein
MFLRAFPGADCCLCAEKGLFEECQKSCWDDASFFSSVSRLSQFHLRTKACPTIRSCACSRVTSVRWECMHDPWVVQLVGRFSFRVLSVVAWLCFSVNHHHDDCVSQLICRFSSLRNR